MHILCKTAHFDPPRTNTHIGKDTNHTPQAPRHAAGSNPTHAATQRWYTAYVTDPFQDALNHLSGSLRKS